MPTESTNQDRAGSVLKYLYTKGYAQTSSICDTLMKCSIQTTRRLLKDIHEEELIDYKELPSEHGRGAGERVYFLNTKGLQSLGVIGYEITRYQKNLQRINVLQLRHFLTVKRVEELLARSVSDTNIYTAETCNEFTDIEKLQIKTVVKNQPFSLRSDAQVRINLGNFELVTIKIEVDMGSENLTQAVVKKLDAYAIFMESNLVKQHAKTFPIYLMFAANENRIASLLQKASKHRLASLLLFLPLEKVEEREELFQSPVILNCSGQNFSLSSLVKSRELLLTFENAVRIAQAKQSSYNIILQSKYSSPSDSFFPMMITINGTNFLWGPEAYLRIYKKSVQNVSQEALFALILSYIPGEDLNQKLTPYKLFLTQEAYRKRLTPALYYGCLIIADDSIQPQALFTSLPPEMKKRTRIILKSDCLLEKIFEENVWITENGERIRLFP